MQKEARNDDMQFLYRREKAYMANLDAVKDIFLGRDTGVVAIGFENGSMAKIAIYDSNDEAMEAIAMIVEQMNTGRRTVIEVPDAEKVRIRLRNRPLPSEHHATGKKTKGHGGS